MKKIRLVINHKDQIRPDYIYAMIKEIGIDEIFIESDSPFTVSFDVEEEKSLDVIDQLNESIQELLNLIDTEYPIQYSVA